MKSWIIALVVSGLNLHGSEIGWDLKADEQIETIAKSDVYMNQEILYQYNGMEWPLRVIRAPHHEKLVVGPLMFQCPFFLISKTLLPFGLFNHLESLEKQFLPPPSFGLYINDGVSFSYKTSLKTGRFYHYGTISTYLGTFIVDRFFAEGGLINNLDLVELLKTPIILQHLSEKIQITPKNLFDVACPTPLITEIDNRDADQEIQQIFQSTTPSNRVFCYQLGDECYKVRIICNPDRSPINKSLYLKVNDVDQSFPIQWNYRYGIMIDKKAPTSLVNHLSQLVNLSWFDWFFGELDICNGTNVPIQIYDRNYSSLVSWFSLFDDEV